MTIKLMSGSRVVKLFEYFFGVRFIGKGHRNNLTNVAFPETITRQKCKSFSMKTCCFCLMYSMRLEKRYLLRARQYQLISVG